MGRGRGEAGADVGLLAGRRRRPAGIDFAAAEPNDVTWKEARRLALLTRSGNPRPVLDLLRANIDHVEHRPRPALELLLGGIVLARVDAEGIDQPFNADDGADPRQAQEEREEVSALMREQVISRLRAEARGVAPDTQLTIDELALTRSISGPRAQAVIGRCFEPNPEALADGLRIARRLKGRRSDAILQLEYRLGLSLKAQAEQPTREFLAHLQVADAWNRRVVEIGATKTLHLRRDGEDKTLCGKTISGVVGYAPRGQWSYLTGGGDDPFWAGEQKACLSCRTSAEARAANEGKAFFADGEEEPRHYPVLSGAVDSHLAASSARITDQVVNGSQELTPESVEGLAGQLAQANRQSIDDGIVDVLLKVQTEEMGPLSRHFASALLTSADRAQLPDAGESWPALTEVDLKMIVSEWRKLDEHLRLVASAMTEPGTKSMVDSEKGRRAFSSRVGGIISERLRAG